jgi:hypothetical protein
MNQLAQTEPRRQWQRQHDEPVTDYAKFLLWHFSDERPTQLPPALHLIALQRGWQARSWLIDKLLNARAETVEQATSAIAADSLSILRHELEFRAAEALANPGRTPLKDLTALLRLLAELGAFAGKTAQPDDQLELGDLSDHEAATLAEAAAILARRRK